MNRRKRGREEDRGVEHFFFFFRVDVGMNNASRLRDAVAVLSAMPDVKPDADK